MAKHTAIRLENNLMIAAKNAAVLNKRTAVEQIEYWAELGQNISRFIGPEALIACSSGLAELKVVHVDASPISASNVFDSLESSRQSGKLIDSVTTSKIRYQASTDYPGLLEKLGSDGRVIDVGTFKNGAFTVIKDKLN